MYSAAQCKSRCCFQTFCPCEIARLWASKGRDEESAGQIQLVSKTRAMFMIHYVCCAFCRNIPIVFSNTCPRQYIPYHQQFEHDALPRVWTPIYKAPVVRSDRTCPVAVVSDSVPKACRKRRTWKMSFSVTKQSQGRKQVLLARP